MSNEYLPPCKFAVDGKVRIMKVVDKDGKSYNGFQWPKSGEVKPETWSEEATCKSGGLFGWAWGLAFGDGKDPSFIDAIWIVFECDAEDTVHLNGKCKAKQGSVIHYGSYEQALHLVIGGQKKYIAKVCEGSPNHSKGNWSASSATGNWSASSATGDWSASSATGNWSASSATGDWSASSATGNWSASSATGNRAASSATGDRSASSATGNRAASSATGDWSASSATGNWSASSATGNWSASSATGNWSVAVITGTCSCVDASGIGCLAVSTASEIYWIVREHSVLVQRTNKGVFVLDAKDYPQYLGQKVSVIHGVIQ